MANMGKVKFFFVWNGKTGGSTFFYYIKNITSGIVRVSERPKGYRISYENSSKENFRGRYDIPKLKMSVGYFNVIAGHVQCSIFKPYFDRPFITWLRNPVDRVISFYRRGLDKGRTRYKTLIECAEDQRNLQTYWTGGDLSKYKFIGITEYFNDDLKRFLRVFGVNNNINYEKRNVSETIINVSNKERQIIKELNKEDFVLYNEALKIRNEKKKSKYM